MSRVVKKLSLAQFLEMPASVERTELVNGEIVPKVLPQYKHALAQGRFFRFIDNWCQEQQCGICLPEWAVVLHSQGQDWVPVPDLTYISYRRLPAGWDEDEPCPVLPELVIEIISPGQSFGEMTQKATDYLQAGISRVWVADTQAGSVTVFGASEFPQTYWVGDIISDPLLPELAIPIADLFVKRGQSPNANES